MYPHLVWITWCLSPSPDYCFQSGYQKYLLKSCSVFNSLSWERFVYIYSSIWHSANFSLRFSNFTAFFLCRNGSLEHFQEIVFECFSCLGYRSVWSRFSRYVQLSFFVWPLSERFSRPVWKNLSVRDFCDPFCRPRFFLCVISSVVYYRSDVDQNSSFFYGEVSRSILQWISDHVSYYPDTILYDADSASLRDLTSFSDVLRFTLR